MARMLLVLYLCCAGCGYRHHYTRVHVRASCWYGAGALDVEHYAQKENE